jgi:PAS domain S-box-containing protein
MLWALTLLLQSRNKALGKLQNIAVAEARKAGEIQLRDARLRVAAALTALDVGTWVWEVTEDRLHIDRNLVEILGFLDVSPIGVPLNSFINRLHREDQLRVKEMILHSVDTGMPYESDFRVIRPDGSLRWVTCRGSAESNEAEQPRTLYGVIIDITKRKASEEALQESEKRFARAIYDSPFPIAIHAQDGRMVTINNIWTEITGYSRDEVPTIAAWTEKAFGEKKAIAKAGIDRLYSIDHKVTDGENFIKTRNGETRIWEFSSVPLGKDSRGMKLVMSTAIDITERKKTETALKESQTRLQLLTESLEEKVIERTAQVRELTKELTLSEQKERKRLSKILHEDLQQVLFSALMRFDLVEMELERMPAESAENMRIVRKNMQRALEMSRTLALELNPPVLPSEGLDASLGWLAHFMGEHYGLRITTHLQGTFREIPEEQRILLVQLVRELFHNILKHAQVKEAVLKSGLEDGELVISVEDKGAGFDPAKILTLRSEEGLLGFHRVEERLRLFGGRLAIQSAPQSGTRVRIVVPLPPKKEPND